MKTATPVFVGADIVLGRISVSCVTPGISKPHICCANAGSSSADKIAWAQSVALSSVFGSAVHAAARQGGKTTLHDQRPHLARRQARYR